MASSINASLTAGLVQTADTSGIINLQSNGTTVASVSSTGVAVTGTLSSTGNTTLGDASTDTLNVGNGNLVTDASGNVGIGVTPSAWYTGNSAKVIELGSVGNGILQYGSAANITSYYLNNALFKTDATFAYGQSGGGASTYRQVNGGHYWNTAPSGTAGNAITLTQVLAVDKDESLALQGATSQTGTGITFPATQSASTDANTLDDYEEGTWTPVQGGGLTVVGAFSSSGRYTKVGRLVTVTGRLAGATSVATTAGTIMFTNLPFTVLELGTTGTFTNSVISVIGGIGAFGTTAYSATTVAATTTFDFNFSYNV